MSSKNCSKCNRDLPISHFFKRSDRTGKLRSWCKGCVSEHSRRDRGEHRRHIERKYSSTPKGQQARRKNKLKKRFNISLDDYATMLSLQNGVCAICHGAETTRSRLGELRHLSIDHDHTTGRIRQLLCSRCNSVLGLANDNITILQAAITYLTVHAALAKPVAVKLKPHTANSRSVSHVVRAG